MNNTLTALPGVRIGHATNKDKLTGCTVVLFDTLYTVAYKSYGGAAGTFNTETLKSGKPWSMRRGLFVAGGGLSGLKSGTEIMDFIAEKEAKNEGAIVPSISGCVVNDLGVQISKYDVAYGREAANNSNANPAQGGNVGAGTGTSVGKFSYTDDELTMAMKAGIGFARIDLGNGIIVCAMSVVNALGNVVLPNGTILAGNRDIDRSRFRTFESSSALVTGKTENTTISIVGINADLGEYSNYERVAHMASQGQVRAISPVNTSLDGDTVFAFSTKEIKYFLSPLGLNVADSGWYNIHIDVIGHAAANAVQESIYDACKQAESIDYDDALDGSVPSCKDRS